MFPDNVVVVVVVFDDWASIILCRTVLVGGGTGTFCLIDASMEVVNSKSLVSSWLLCCIMVAESRSPTSQSSICLREL